MSQNCEVAARSPPLAAGRTDARNGLACVGHRPMTPGWRKLTQTTWWRHLKARVAATRSLGRPRRARPPRGKVFLLQVKWTAQDRSLGCLVQPPQRVSMVGRRGLGPGSRHRGVSHRIQAPGRPAEGPIIRHSCNLRNCAHRVERCRGQPIASPNGYPDLAPLAPLAPLFVPIWARGAQDLQDCSSLWSPFSPPSVRAEPGNFGDQGRVQGNPSA